MCIKMGKLAEKNNKFISYHPYSLCSFLMTNSNHIFIAINTIVINVSS